MSAYTDGGQTYGAASGGVGTTIQSLTIVSTGAPIEIFASALIEGTTSSGQGAIIQIYRDSTKLMQTDNFYIPGTNGVPYAGGISDTPGAGTFTYYLKAARTFGTTANQNARHRYLRALETKK